jgi:hypothetical protein
MTTKNKKKQKETKRNKKKQKETKRNKKGGMFMNQSKIPKRLISRSFFDKLKDMFDTIETKYVDIVIDNEQSFVNININHQNSFVFYVNDKTLRIIQVIKRTNIEISRFIKIIIDEFNTNESFNRLELGDTSKIVFNFDTIIYISLFKLKILETSQTWYEKLGFKNDSLDSKREEIVRFINQKIVDVFDKSKLTDHTDKIDIDNILIKDFMVFVKQILKGENTKETIIYFRDIVDSLYELLIQQTGVIDLYTNYIQK